MASDKLSVLGYAKYRGITHRAVQKAIETGRLQRCLSPGPNGRQLIDPNIADSEWQANTDQSKPSNTVTGKPKNAARAAKAEPEDTENEASDAPKGPSFNQSRAIREAYQARLAKLDYEERSGKVVNADEVRLAAYNAARKARDMLLSIPDRVAPIVAGLSDTYECHQAMTEEIKRVCAELGGVLNAG